ncbi:response regulator transcription factor [Alkalilimnicola ehrlichii MLHE-1]|uniref:Two component transcriptional regulator, LuxR family n=1 Tax=Alkalilimnicola ehrlichii (strain ATCC BAA-1101 / DSM 17681 / MLHE-1) TaxID=187272 RepID=Q0A7K9_ALKEH|nr:LuxR C-terminal-related transcriptional regulator [Alkalilimnicola ehrlichii]ABI57178.1 two component transcriptional regulator, LuxR family [Alkalilimnicola ehrlichii MLHE-1]
MSDLETGAGTVCLSGFPAEEAERLTGLLQGAGLRVTLCTRRCREGGCERGEVPGCVLLNLDADPDCLASLDRALGPGSAIAPLVALVRTPAVAPVVQALRHGAWDVLRVPVSDQLLLDTVCHAVQAGQARVQEHRRRQRLCTQMARLTQREQEVFRALARGGSHRDIAQGLGISPRTLEVHRARLYRKLRIETYTELVRMAVLVGVLDRYPLLPEVERAPGGALDRPS